MRRMKRSMWLSVVMQDSGVQGKGFQVRLRGGSFSFSNPYPKGTGNGVGANGVEPHYGKVAKSPDMQFVMKPRAGPVSA